jgi:hypothetical protein
MSLFYWHEFLGALFGFPLSLFSQSTYYKCSLPGLYLIFSLCFEVLSAYLQVFVNRICDFCYWCIKRPAIYNIYTFYIYICIYIYLLQVYIYVVQGFIYMCVYIIYTFFLAVL